VAVVVALATGALRDDGAGRYPIEAELEPEALQRSEMAAAAFSLARAVLTASDDAIFSVDGPSVPTTLCAYRVHGAPRCSYGEGASLTDAVRAAAEGLARDLPAGAVPLLAIDFETDRRDVTVGQPGHRPRDPGLWGWRWHHEQGVAVLPPAAVLALDVFGGDDEDDKRFRPERLRDELLRRAPAELPPPDEQTALVTYK
jgi:hypothetical protein